VSERIVYTTTRGGVSGVSYTSPRSTSSQRVQSCAISFWNVVYKLTDCKLLTNCNTRSNQCTMVSDSLVEWPLLWCSACSYQILWRGNCVLIGMIVDQVRESSVRHMVRQYVPKYWQIECSAWKWLWPMGVVNEQRSVQRHW
jgi:hypothetical protein